MNLPYPREHVRVDVVVSDTAVRESTRILLDVYECLGNDYASGTEYILGGVHDIDCLLTDRVLSDMSGLELLEHLRTSGDTTPAVMMTGWTDLEMISRAKRLSLTLLDKPALSESLLHSIYHATEEASEPTGSATGDVAQRFPASFDPKEARHPSWIENAGTGVAIFDAEHRQMSDMAMDFYDAILSGESQSALSAHFKALTAVAAEHISHEENYMRFAEYPELERHSAVHRQMMQELDRAPLTNIRNSENRAARALEVLRFLKHWLMDHVLSDDRKLGAYLNCRGIH
jgi:hemerythrin-like metal-binding protein